MHSVLADASSLMAVTLAQFSLLGLWSQTWPYLLMVLGFSVIVFVHELGHFAVAKWAGVRVERFAVGFGREIVGFTRGETRYSFNILPLGGYVKMLGQEDFDDKSKELRFKDDPGSFINKPVGHRMAIVSAGVVMNIIFACLLFMVVFMIGMNVPAAKIGAVDPNSPAHRAGLLPGDEIVSINGETVLEWRDVSMAVQLAPPHEPLDFVIRREDIEKSLRVKPSYRRPDNTREPRRQIIGILPGVTREIVAVPPDTGGSGANRPQRGDVIVEIDGTPITDENASQASEMIAYATELVVERPDGSGPEAPVHRVRVEVDPQLVLFPSDRSDPNSVSVLGLAPLMRFGFVDPRGRAALAGIEVGDTILGWDDDPHPTRSVIHRSIRDKAGEDIAFVVKRMDGQVFRGFVRPKLHKTGPGTVQATYRHTNDPDNGAKAALGSVRPHGAASLAGLEAGDKILSLNGVAHPTVQDMSQIIRASVGTQLPVVVQKADGREVGAVLVPQEPGSIDASYNVVAEDVLVVGHVVETIGGRPSPAAAAGVPNGARIVAAGGEAVGHWRDMIAVFRKRAGETIPLELVDLSGATRVVSFAVPRSLRTILGVDSAAQILSIDGRKTVSVEAGRGEEEVAVGHGLGTQTILQGLVGRKGVVVEYRPTPLAEPVTSHVDVTEDMVDPWLGRVVFHANFYVGTAMKVLQGENAWDSMKIGLHKTYYFVLTVYETINRMVFTRTVSVDSLSGPLGIVAIGGQVARAGLVHFLFFLGIISANLAVINFLPLPIVDGGLMVFLIVEKIKGSPVSLRVQIATQMVGLFLIIGAFLFVTYQDAVRLLG